MSGLANHLNVVLWTTA